MDKQELLDAIARSGSAGKAAYEQAQQGLAAQQAEAVRMALSSGVAGQAPAGAQAELQRIISEPYQTRTAQLTQNQAAMQDWYNRLGAARGAWADQQNALQQYALEQALAQATGGGGGGGGGGGTTKTPKEKTWEDLLNEQFGSTTLAEKALPVEAQAAGYTDWKTTGMSPTAGIRQYASEAYGVPAATSAALFPESQFQQTYGTYGARLPGYTRKQARQGLKTIIEQSKQYPGQYTGYTVAGAKKAAAEQYGKKFVKKTSRKANQ